MKKKKKIKKGTFKTIQARVFFSQTFGKKASANFILSFILTFSSTVIKLQKPLLIFFMVNHINQILNSQLSKGSNASQRNAI